MRPIARFTRVSRCGETMEVLLLYLILCLLPGGAFLLLERCYRAWSGVTPWRSARAEPEVDIQPTHPPLERLVADLHRLDLELDRLERSNEAGRVHRLEAATMAYDDTLRSCCAALDLPFPPQRRLGGVDRLQVEADLSKAGLTW